jgi:hypothetical protein
VRHQDGGIMARAGVKRAARARALRYGAACDARRDHVIRSRRSQHQPINRFTPRIVGHLGLQLPGCWLLAGLPMLLLL